MRHTFSISCLIWIGGWLVAAAGCEFDPMGVSQETADASLVSCGNSAIDPGEACDGTDLGGETCATVPGDFTGGTLTCSASCEFDTSGCDDSVCGDGIQAPSEECDDGNTSNEDACTNACGNAVCGDTYTWTGHEECDDGNASNEDACLTDCTLPTCGDGHVWTGQELCDDGGTAPGDGCSATCQEEAGWDCTDSTCVEVCGDLVVVGDE